MKDRLKQLRISAKYSQKFVAVSVGVAAPTVSMWESGTKAPSIENLCRLADLYGTTVDYLVGRSPEAGNAARPPKLTDAERQLIASARRLNALGLGKLIDYARDLTENDRYKKETASGRKAE